MADPITFRVIGTYRCTSDGWWEERVSGDPETWYRLSANECRRMGLRCKRG